MVDFNSHARVGRDEITIYKAASCVYFNSHARVGRDIVPGAIHIQGVYFNSHARVGRDGAMLEYGFATDISTHTPV